MNFNLDLRSIKLFISENQKKVRMAALIFIVGFSILFFWFSGNGDTIEMDQTEVSETDGYLSEEAVDEETENAEVKTGPVSVCYVDISGEVKSPGVYKVNSETRLFEVIDMAGGLTKKADVNSLNRAERVTDGQKVIVRAVGEKGESGEEGSSDEDEGYEESIDSEGRVNINYADSITLQMLPGIGPSKAQSIIDHREKTGKFNSIEEIMNVSGIGEKTFTSIKDLITV